MRKAFTLMELMLVVIIIAILASIAIPSYIKTMERAKAREAMATLQSMRAAELAYSSERRQFITLSPSNDNDWKAVGMDNPNDNAQRAWNYDLQVTGSTTFNATATRADGPNTGQTIIMDDGGNVSGSWNP